MASKTEVDVEAGQTTTYCFRLLNTSGLSEEEELEVEGGARGYITGAQQEGLCEGNFGTTWLRGHLSYHTNLSQKPPSP